VDIDVPRYINLIRTKRFKEASALIRESVPFARTLSYICPHPCETKCRRNELNEPISICALKRFVIEKHSCNFLGGSAISPPEKTVAIVGAGPTGLTAAYYLRKLGYAVTLYDAAQSPGGMMRVGIPAYRLPREVLQSDIDEILNMGIDLKLRTKLGEELTLEALQAQYDAVLLAIGAQRSIRLKLEGTELNNVFWGLEFLRATNTGTPPNINGYRVVVIGGGNVAIDVALTALRLGAKDVQLACLERYDEMPAFKWEIDQALEEGVKLNFCWGPHRIIGDTADNVRAIELVRCTTVFDNEGKFNPRFDFTVRTTMDTDAVILAVGQIPDFSFIDRDTGLEVVDGRMLKVNQETLETTVRKIYAGGDVVKGPSSVVEAIAMGRKSALSIDKQLGGTGELPSGTELRTEPAKPHWPGSSEPEFYAKPRVRMPKLPVESRKNNFSAVELGFDESMALEEASRCLSCDLRFELREVPSPPVPSEKWIDFTIEQLQTVPETAGVYQLLDSNKAIVYIKGTPNLREALVEEYKLRTEKAVRYFEFEEEPLYTKRESELLQDHLQKYGKMPLFNEELEDLF
jgi:NADPH-dependent glutamate synthase beta subunit-like oxidoreductase